MRALIQVTDHAIVRWLERVCGFDIEALKAEIVAAIPERAAASVAAVGQGGVKLPSGASLMLRRDGGVLVVTTIVTRGGGPIAEEAA